MSKNIIAKSGVNQDPVIGQKQNFSHFPRRKYSTRSAKKDHSVTKGLPVKTAGLISLTDLSTGRAQRC
eukprot:1159957-Pelagomonas_calceolata.AAC.9